MKHNDIFAIGFASLYLVIYVVLLQFGNTRPYSFILLLFSPFIICWMVYTVLKYGKYDGQELGNEEFGYHDRCKDQLGVT